MIVAALLTLLVDDGPLRVEARARIEMPRASLEQADELSFVNETDSNSPALWQLVDGRPLLHVLNSMAGRASLSAGRNLQRLQDLDEIAYSNAPPGGTWMEALVADEAGAWYGYYHNEIVGDVCPATSKAMPRIGAARSFDRGRTWADLGPVLEAPAATVRCTTRNGYFVGGVGDFSVMLDRNRDYLYIFYTQYIEEAGQTGVSVARMDWAGRDQPQGRVTVWNAGAWLPADNVEIVDEATGDPIYSRWVYPTATPVHVAQNRWDNADPMVDVWWGPAVHWNTYLGSYVMLLNRAVSNEWSQGSIDISYSASLDDPSAWTMPATLMKGGSWYPQVMGLGYGTDKVAGAQARFYMAGTSTHIVRFEKP